VTSGYLLALALILPLNGWLVDRIGAKALYLGCFTAFTLSSALCGLAWSANSLIVFRIFQGMSGGLLAPMAQMTIARVAGKHMAQVVSVAALPVLLAPLLGPVMAGAILQFASWRRDRAVSTLSVWLCCRRAWCCSFTGPTIWVSGSASWP
jgi:MFS family permease